MEDNRETRIWWTDIPDSDVIRVKDTYYMSSTTMHFTPGCPIMKSKDLIHWEIVNYVYETLADSDEMSLTNGKHDYGRGSWANCIRYADDTFYAAFTAYNANKTYIFLIAWPDDPSSSQRRIELCYRSDRIDGVYEGRVVCDSDMGVHNRGVAQGGIFETEDGAWYSLMFQDHGSVGRIPVLVPVSWKEGWPVFGISGGLPDRNAADTKVSCGCDVVKSDDFDNQISLFLEWQWNHNCDSRFWSLSERPGWLKLTNGSICTNLSNARNTLTQRTFGPVCSGRILLDLSEMKNGDFAGLGAFQDQYGYVGVMMTETAAKVIMATAEPEPYDPADMQYESGKPEIIVESIPLKQTEIYLRVDFDFRDMVDTACFYYSLDGSIWNRIGSQLNMSYRLTHFVGYRFALFSYATKETGGSVFFDYFKVCKE